MDPEWVAAIAALVAAVFTAAAWLGARLWRIMRRATHFFDDYFGQPARDGLEARPGVMARLGSVEKLIEQVAAEMSPNHGHSLRDDVSALRSEQAKLRARVELFEKQRAHREGDP
ncbi:MAG: hypothetical protein ACRDP5_28335 [Streptosporangiaceae bacterium]